MEPMIGRLAQASDKDMNSIWTVYFGEEGTETARGIGFRDDKVFVAGLSESDNFNNGGSDVLLLVYPTLTKT